MPHHTTHRSLGQRRSVLSDSIRRWLRSPRLLHGMSTHGYATVSFLSVLIVACVFYASKLHGKCALRFLNISNAFNSSALIVSSFSMILRVPRVGCCIFSRRSFALRTKLSPHRLHKLPLISSWHSLNSLTFPAREDCNIQLCRVDPFPSSGNAIVLDCRWPGTLGPTRSMLYLHSTTKDGPVRDEATGATIPETPSKNHPGGYIRRGRRRSIFE